MGKFICKYANVALGERKLFLFTELDKSELKDDDFVLENGFLILPPPTLSQKMFKAVAQISSDAVWVKDDDELNQVNVTFRSNGHPAQFSSSLNPIETTAFIQCSQCKFYH